MSLKVNWDAMGIFTSIACAIHCAALPLILSALPIFGVNIIHNNFFEWVMITIAFCIGIFALFHGYSKHHGSIVPLLIFSSGFIFLVLKQFFSSLEYWFLAVAVVSIVSAHFYNYRLSRKNHGKPNHEHSL